MGKHKNNFCQRCGATIIDGTCVLCYATATAGGLPGVIVKLFEGADKPDVDEYLKAMGDGTVCKTTEPGIPKVGYRLPDFLARRRLEPDEIFMKIINYGGIKTDGKREDGKENS